MRKRILMLGISTVFMFSLVACGSKETVMETTKSTAEDLIAENVDDSEEITTEKKETSPKETTEKTNGDNNKDITTEKKETPQKETTEKMNEDNNKETTETRTTESIRTSVNNNSTNSNTETSKTNERTTEKTTERTMEKMTEKATTQHTHNWIPITRHHDAVYETRVTPAVVHNWWCRNCKRSYPSTAEDPCNAKGTLCGGSCQIIISPIKEERVLVQEAYDEVVGYRCSCGATCLSNKVCKFFYFLELQNR